MTAIKQISARAEIVGETYAKLIRHEKKLGKVSPDASEKVGDYYELSQKDWSVAGREPTIVSVVSEWRGLKTALEILTNHPAEVQPAI